MTIKYQLDCKFCQSSGHCEKEGGVYEDSSAASSQMRSIERRYSGWSGGCTLTPYDDAPPETDPFNPYGATHRIEITLPENFADALVRSSDFYVRVGGYCDYMGYELKNINQVFSGTLFIDVKKKGSWDVAKLAGAIIGIIGIVLIAIFSGSVVLGALAVGGAFVAIHFIVRSFLNNSVILDSQENIVNGMQTLKDVIPIIQNDPNLTTAQKAELIGEIVNSITQAQEEIGETIPAGGGTGGGGAGGSSFSTAVLLGIAAVAAFILIKGRKK